MIRLSLPDDLEARREKILNDLTSEEGLEKKQV